MDHSAGSAVPPTDRGAGSSRPRPSYRRALRVGMAVSVAAHAAALLIYPRLTDRDATAPVPFVLPSAGQPVEGMSVIRLLTVADEALLERPDEPEEIEELEQPDAEAGTPELPGVPERGLVAPGPTAAERLRPRLEDERLWRALDPELNELTLEQRLELELATRISEITDSLDAAIEAERALTDWTYTDDEGKRWGVSPGKIHLGDLTIPLPFGFGTPIGKRDEVARRAWEWEEIQRGAANGAVRDSWKERAQAIRERRDRERAAARPDTIGGRR